VKNAGNPAAKYEVTPFRICTQQKSKESCGSEVVVTKALLHVVREPLVITVAILLLFRLRRTRAEVVRLGDMARQDRSQCSGTYQSILYGALVKVSVSFSRRLKTDLYPLEGILLSAWHLRYLI
jgi:hypothetical protein